MEEYEGLFCVYVPVTRLSKNKHIDKAFFPSEEHNTQARQTTTPDQINLR